MLKKERLPLCLASLVCGGMSGPRVLREVYANEDRYANERPNLDVNYSARLIIICLMGRKLEERSEMEGLP